MTSDKLHCPNFLATWGLVIKCWTKSCKQKHWLWLFLEGNRLISHVHFVLFYSHYSINKILCIPSCKPSRPGLSNPRSVWAACSPGWLWMWPDAKIIIYLKHYLVVLPRHVHFLYKWSQTWALLDDFKTLSKVPLHNRVITWGLFCLSMVVGIMKIIYGPFFVIVHQFLLVFMYLCVAPNNSYSPTVVQRHQRVTQPCCRQL